MFQQLTHSALDTLFDLRFFIKQKSLSAKQQKAESITQKSPNSAKGYLSLAKVFIDQNKTQEAIEVYDNGIKYIASLLEAIPMSSSDNRKITYPVEQDQSNKDNISDVVGQQNSWKLQNEKKKNDAHNDACATQHQELLTLKQEKQKILATTMHRSFSYEILFEIFSYLDDFQDLWQCKNVCKQWWKFMFTFSPFWSKLSPTDHDASWCHIVVITDKYKLRHDVCVQNNNRYTKAAARMSIKNVLNILLSARDNHNIEKLCFQQITFKDKKSVHLLENVLKHMKRPPLKHVEFYRCKILDKKHGTPILPSCSALTRISYTTCAKDSYGNDVFDYDINKNGKHLALLPMYSTLTYLQLRFEYPSSKHNAANIRTLLFGDNMLLSRAPNLMHLFLNFYIPEYETGPYVEAVLKSCPRLKNLVLGTGSMEVPHGIFLCDLNENEFENNHKDINTDSLHTMNHSTSNNDNILSTTTNNNNICNKDNGKSTIITEGESLSSSTSSNDTSLRQLCSPSTVTKSLCRFVILNSSPHQMFKYINVNEKVVPYSERPNRRSAWERCFSMLSKFNQALELLYICSDITAIQSLHTWVSYPGIEYSLRELHLRMDDHHDNINHTLEEVIGPIDKSNLLVKLFPCLPALEALSISQSRPTPDSPKAKYSYLSSSRSHKPGHLYVDDEALKQLAKHCRRIQYIRIYGHISYTPQGVLFLLTNKTEESNACDDTCSIISATLPITYLNMYIPSNIILQLVKKLQSLKNLRIQQTDRRRLIEDYTHNDKTEAAAILRERDGSMGYYWGSCEVYSYDDNIVTDGDESLFSW